MILDTCEKLIVAIMCHLQEIVGSSNLTGAVAYDAYVFLCTSHICVLYFLQMLIIMHVFILFNPFKILTVIV